MALRRFVVCPSRGENRAGGFQFESADGKPPVIRAEVEESVAEFPASDSVAPAFPSDAATAHCARGAPLLTVIVPVFNEARTLDDLLRQVVASPYDKQIIVVDDGSTDGSSEIISVWESTALIEVCRHAANRGKGRAVRSALERARGQFTIIQDADLETNPLDYPLLIEPLLSRSADCVLGSRFLGDKAPIFAFFSLFRIGVGMLNFAVRVLYGTRISDEACCYKALPTSTLKAMNLTCERFEFCPEVVAKASRMGLRIHEVGIRYCRRPSSLGKKIRYRDGLYALWWLWRLRRPANHD